MAKTTKNTKSVRSAKSSKRNARHVAHDSTFHKAVFAKASAAKRCGHESKSGKVCCRFAGHDKTGKVPHFYVTKAELKRRVEAWKERFAA